MIELVTANSTLTVAPELGGSVLGLSLNGVPVLRDGRSATHVLETAGFPLFPFAGRIDQGRFTFEGTQVHLAANFPPEPHAIHGACWQKPWQIETHNSTSLSLAREHDGQDWPWRYRSRQHFALSQTTLTLSLSLTNLSDRAMPAGFGWHPYFPAHGATLEAQAGDIWAPDLSSPTPDKDLSGPRAIEALTIDHAYRWPARTASLELGAHGPSVILSASDIFEHLVVFTPPGEDYFCVEPLSHAPNAVNLDLPPSVTGLRRLDPGETVTGTITLALV